MGDDRIRFGPMSDVTKLRDGLRSALKGALASRDRTAVAALRSALAALDNAEAVPVRRVTAVASEGPIAGAALGVGAAEVPRRRLTRREAALVIERQIDERRVAADEYDRLGRADAAVRLRREADVLVAHVPV